MSTLKSHYNPSLVTLNNTTLVSNTPFVP